MQGRESIVEKPLQVSYLNDFIFPLHVHREIEIIYACEGNIVLNIDGGEYTLSKDEIAIIFPDVVHGYIEKEGIHGKGVLFICQPELAGDYAELLMTKQSLNKQA